MAGTPPPATLQVKMLIRAPYDARMEPWTVIGDATLIPSAKVKVPSGATIHTFWQRAMPPASAVTEALTITDSQGRCTALWGVIGNQNDGDNRSTVQIRALVPGIMDAAGNEISQSFVSASDVRLKHGSAVRFVSDTQMVVANSIEGLLGISSTGGGSASLDDFTPAQFITKIAEYSPPAPGSGTAAVFIPVAALDPTIATTTTLDNAFNDEDIAWHSDAEDDTSPAPLDSEHSLTIPGAAEGETVEQTDTTALYDLPTVPAGEAAQVNTYATLTTLNGIPNGTTTNVMLFVGPGPDTTGGRQIGSALLSALGEIRVPIGGDIRPTDRKIWAVMHTEVPTNRLIAPASINIGIAFRGSSAHGTGPLSAPIRKVIREEIVASQATANAMFAKQDARLNSAEASLIQARSVTDQLKQIDVPHPQNVPVRVGGASGTTYYRTAEDRPEGDTTSPLLPGPLAEGANLVGVPSQWLSNSGQGVTVLVWEGSDTSQATTYVFGHDDIEATYNDGTTNFFEFFVHAPANASFTAYANGLEHTLEILEQVKRLIQQVDGIEARLAKPGYKAIDAATYDDTAVPDTVAAAPTAFNLNLNVANRKDATNGAYAVWYDTIAPAAQSGARRSADFVIVDWRRAANKETGFHYVRISEGKVQHRLDHAAVPEVRSTRTNVITTSAGFHEVDVQFGDGNGGADSTSFDWTLGLPTASAAVTLRVKGYINASHSGPANINQTATLNFGQGEGAGSPSIELATDSGFDTGVNYNAYYINSNAAIRNHIVNQGNNLAVNYGDGLFSADWSEEYVAQVARAAYTTWEDIADVRTGDAADWDFITGLDMTGDDIVVVTDTDRYHTGVPVSDAARNYFVGDAFETYIVRQAANVNFGPDIISSLQHHTGPSEQIPDPNFVPPQDDPDATPPNITVYPDNLGLYDIPIHHEGKLNLFCQLTALDADNQRFTVKPASAYKERKVIIAGTGDPATTFTVPEDVELLYVLVDTLSQGEDWHDTIEVDLESMADGMTRNFICDSNNPGSTGGIRVVGVTVTKPAAAGGNRALTIVNSSNPPQGGGVDIIDVYYKTFS